MNLYFEEKGPAHAPTIVFLHGGGVGSWMWEKQLEYFKDYHCLVPDLPGQGKSADSGAFTLEGSVRQVAELIEARAQQGRAHVVGHSLGAKVLVQLLSEKPVLVDHAVIASALYRPIPFLQWTHRPSVYKFTVAMLRRPWYALYSARQFRFPEGACETSCLEDFSHYTPDFLYRVYDELYAHLDLPEGLDQAGNPVLVVAGEREPAAMRGSVSDMVSALPHAVGVLLKNAQHTYPWVLHEDFDRIVSRFLKGMDVKGDKAVCLPVRV